MNKPHNFFTDLFHQPKWVSLWVTALAACNLASLFFWPERIAVVISLVFIVSAILMISFYMKFGFERILGAGHFLWIPLVVYICMNIYKNEPPLRYYLVVELIFISISLIFDITDVIRYCRDKRKN